MSCCVFAGAIVFFPYINILSQLPIHCSRLIDLTARCCSRQDIAAFAFWSLDILRDLGNSSRSDIKVLLHSPWVEDTRSPTDTRQRVSNLPQSQNGTKASGVLSTWAATASVSPSQTKAHQQLEFYPPSTPTATKSPSTKPNTTRMAPKSQSLLL